ncbi:MAG: M15 family metallopeptidase [Nostoc sp.]|uniref:M15 family metallopeptidase n=1 Tax=Nostoc sp. TaxID=1180 RepID=UPI002FF9D773
MSERIGRNKSAASTFTNPSLASPGIPTLANPIRGFGSQINTVPPQTVTEVAPDLQEAQSADEQSLEPEVIQEKPLSHDISRIPLRRPQAKLMVGQPEDPDKQQADWVCDRIMRMVTPWTANQVMRQVLPRQLHVSSVQPMQESLQLKSAADDGSKIIQREDVPAKQEDPWDLMAQELGKNSYDECVAELKETTFLGQSVKQVHPELIDMLQKAEPNIKQALGNDYKIGVSSTLRRKQSLHGWGLAIDFDVLHNPYILNEAGEQKLDQELTTAYDEIANFMLGTSSSINSIKQGRSGFGNSVGNAYDKLKLESDAQKQYFAFMSDESKLKEFLLNNWQRLHPDNAMSPNEDTLNAEVKEVQNKIKNNYLILGGKDENNKPLPVKSGGDRPFAPNSGGGKGDPKTGFLNMPKEFVIAMTDAGFAWGGIDLAGASGDIQHFDTRKGTYGSTVLPIIRKYRPKKK